MEMVTVYLRKGFAADSLRELKTGIQATCCEWKQSLLRFTVTERAGLHFKLVSNVRRGRDVRYS